MCRLHGFKHAVATVNGTAALHVSLLACGVNSEDEVMVPALTFIATVNAVKYCKSEPIFFDCVDDTLGLDINKVKEFLDQECFTKDDGFTYNLRTKKKIKAIIPVHIFGHPVDMEPLLELSRKYNILIIEDAAESIGSKYKGRPTGSFGKLSCFSFNGNKIVTTGGGGLVGTDDKELADKIKHLTTQAKTNHPYEYDHDTVGFNYRLTNVLAALGLAQLEKLEDFIKIKRDNAALYRELFQDMEEVKFFWEQDWAQSNFWFYTIKVPEKMKNNLLEYLIAEKIQARPIWKLMHTLPMYEHCQSYAIEQASKAYNSCINIPCSVNIKKEEIHLVVEKIGEFLSRKSSR
jgi:perosamine synthetase